MIGVCAKMREGEQTRELRGPVHQPSNPVGRGGAIRGFSGEQGGDRLDDRGNVERNLGLIPGGRANLDLSQTTPTGPKLRAHLLLFAVGRPGGGLISQRPNGSGKLAGLVQEGLSSLTQANFGADHMLADTGFPGPVEWSRTQHEGATEQGHAGR